MKGYVFALMFLMLATAVSAAQLQVKAVDEYGANLQNVVVAPEWKASVTGWNDFFPKEKTTGSNGLTSTWYAVVPGISLQVNYATLDGYTCTRGLDTRITAAAGLNKLTTVCTQNNEVPEFSAVAAVVAVAGAVAGIALLRKQ